MSEGVPKVWAGARIAVLSPTPTHPQDFGNRKRIFRICSRYAEEGARVTFIHYPAELEWREQIPYRASRAMSAAWAENFTIPPTRLLHVDPAGTFHSIDEWWDEAIGDFLTWLFSVESFDIFIVNYSWLSKALDFAPPTTFKILDTHDKFSGRRDVLASLGLNPEFFYTTEAQEGIALGRADLVWAIKPEEAVELALLSEKPIVALPHLDPFSALEPAQPDAHGYLRVGVIGARNNINRMNITEFLRVAEPIFRDAFAPVKVVIAGSVCDLLEGIGGPFVELAGMVVEVEDFYRTVDCVAIPMARSTGLKIKTGEALSLGLPVISLAHAFEGYEASTALHSLADFEEMARAIVELSFAPRARLDALAAASRQAHRKTASAITRAFNRSDALVFEKRRLIVLAVDSRAFVSGTVFNLALRSVYEPVCESVAVAVLVVSGSAAEIAANPDAVDRFRRVIVAEDLADAQAHRDELAVLGVDVLDVGACLKRVRPTVVIVDAMHPALAAADLPHTGAVFRTEMIAMTQGRGQSVEVSAAGYHNAILAAPVLTREIAGRMQAGFEFEASSVFWRSSALKFRTASDHSGKISLAVLGSPDAPAVAMTADMARAWAMAPTVVQGFGGAMPDGRAIPVEDYVAAVLAGRTPPPDFAVDLSGEAPGLALCRELLERLHVPVISTARIGLHPSLALGPRDFFAATEREMWNVLRACTQGLSDTQALWLKRAWYSYEYDWGWTGLWSRCTQLLENVDMHLA